MKNIFKLLVVLLLCFNINLTFATVVDHFEVTFPKDTALSLESIDVTIKALDKNNDIVTDYTGNVIAISQTDDGIELPEDLADDKGYSFKLSDQGVKKFENGIIFSTPGEHTLNVYDLSDYENLIGIGEITIIESGNNEQTVEIEILSPDTNTTLPEDKINVSGATKKNHQVKIELNNKEQFTTTSNSDGIFEKLITGLETGENILKAYVLDSDDNIIGESEEIVVRIDNNKPVFKKISLSPINENGEVEEGTNIDIKVFATSKLKAVKLLFNDGIINLSESEDGVYTGGFKAPNEENEYSMDVVLADDLGHNLTEKDVTSIKVIALNIAIELPEEEQEIITCTGATKEELKINGLKLVELKNKSVLTWDKSEKAESYDIFMKNDETGKFDFIKNSVKPIFETDITGEKIKYQYFAVKSKAEGCGSGEVITGNLSEATKIKTGPTEIILMLLLSLILGFGFITIKRNNA